jgi:hypothetical protein
MVAASNPTAPSLLLVEAGMTLVVAAIACLWPRTANSFFRRAERFCGRWARRRGLSVLTVGVAALLLRLCILPVVPVPQPFVHDEFSFLLAGDTFASGRLTNPTHPMWQHLESFHIDWQPTYMSMYFPAQGMVLAAGRAWVGHPWAGVCLSVALMCAALCWMLQGWLPPGWALLGGMLAVLRLGLFSYWVNSYYGGAVAALGGALVLGALPRMRIRVRLIDGIAMAVGAGILANSRPWEGLLVCLPVCVLLVKRRMTWRPVLRRAAAPVAILTLVAVGMGYYNYRVFGSPLTLPYEVNRMTYASAPHFLWQSPRPEPVYRHRVMREFYTRWELGDFNYARTAAGFVVQTAQKVGIAAFFFCGVALFIPLVMLPRVIRDRRMRYLVLAGAFYSVGLCVNAWLFPHYLAPFTAGYYALLLQCLRHLRAWRPGLALARTVPALCVILCGVRLLAGPMGISLSRWPTMWYGTEPLGLERARVAREIESHPGKQLAIVRYSDRHVVFDDWVYNAADVDGSKVVWAREMDPQSNRELLSYFHDRQVWLVEPDSQPSRISPYRDQATLSEAPSIPLSRISR